MSKSGLAQTYGFYYNIFTHEEKLNLLLQCVELHSEETMSQQGNELKYQIMRVHKNQNTSGVLSYIKEGDYFIAVNGVSVSSFVASFTRSQWDKQFELLKNPRLICFYRNGVDASKTILTNMVKYGNRMCHTGFVYGITSQEEISYLKQTYGISFNEDLSSNIPSVLTIANETIMQSAPVYSLSNNYIMYSSDFSSSSGVIMPLHVAKMSNTTQSNLLHELYRYYQALVSHSHDFCQKTKTKKSAVFHQYQTSVNNALQSRNHELVVQSLYGMCDDLQSRAYQVKEAINASNPLDNYCEGTLSIISNIKGSIDTSLARMQSHTVILPSQSTGSSIVIQQRESMDMAEKVKNIKQIRQFQSVHKIQQLQQIRAQSAVTREEVNELSHKEKFTSQAETEVRLAIKKAQSLSTNAKHSHKRHEKSQSKEDLVIHLESSSSREKRSADNTNDSSKVKKVYSVYPQKTPLDVIVRERFPHKEEDLNTVSFVTKNVSSHYPDLYHYAYVNTQHFSVHQSKSISNKSVKEQVSGPFHSIAVSPTQFRLVVNEMQGRSSIGKCSSFFYGEQTIPAKFPTPSSVEHEKSYAYLSDESEQIVSKILQNIEDNKSMIWEEIDRINRLMVYCHLVLELWSKQKQVILVMATQKYFTLFQYCFQRIGDNAIPCIDFATVRSNEYPKEKGGVLFVNCMDLLQQESSTDSSEMIDRLASWYSDRGGVLVVDNIHEGMEGVYTHQDFSLIYNCLGRLQDSVKSIPILYTFENCTFTKETLLLLKRLHFYGEGCNFQSIESLLDCLPPPHARNAMILKHELFAKAQFFYSSHSLHACTMITHTAGLPRNMIPILPQIGVFWTTTFNAFKEMFEIRTLYEDCQQNKTALTEEGLMSLEHLTAEYFWDYYWLHFKLFWMVLNLTAKIPDLLTLAWSSKKEGKQVILLLDDTKYNLMKFIKKRIAVYSIPPVGHNSQAFLDKNKSPDSIFTKSMFADPRFILQHLVDHTITYLHELGQAKQTTTQKLQLDKQHALKELNVQEQLETVTMETVRDYHLAVINRLTKQVREQEGAIKVPVSPYDVIISHLGAQKVAEISERSYQVMVHTPGVKDMSTIQLQGRMENDPTVTSDYLDKEYYYIKERGSTWNDLALENQNEWDAFCKGKKSFCLVSSAVQFPFALQAKLEKPIDIVYLHVSEHYNPSLSLIHYLSSMSPVNCHILQSDITEQIFIHSCMSDCAQRGGVVKHAKEPLRSIHDDMGLESWKVLVHSILDPHTMDPLRKTVLPANYSFDVVTEEDREKIEWYNAQPSNMKGKYIRDLLIHHGVTTSTTLTEAFTRLNECSTINKEIIVRYFHQVLRAVEQDWTLLHRTDQIGLLECQEEQLQMNEYQIQSQSVRVFHFTTNCSLSYQSLQNLSQKGYALSHGMMTSLFFKGPEGILYVEGEKGSSRETWKADTVVTVRSPSCGALPQKCCYGELSETYQEGDVTPEEWDQYHSLDQQVFVAELPSLCILGTLFNKKHINACYHVCKIVVRGMSETREIFGIRLTSEDIQLLESVSS